MLCFTFIFILSWIHLVTRPLLKYIGRGHGWWGSLLPYLSQTGTCRWIGRIFSFAFSSLLKGKPVVIKQGKVLRGQRAPRYPSYPSFVKHPTLPSLHLPPPFSRYCKRFQKWNVLCVGSNSALIKTFLLHIFLSVFNSFIGPGDFILFSPGGEGVGQIRKKITLTTAFVEEIKMPKPHPLKCTVVLPLQKCKSWTLFDV